MLGAMVVVLYLTTWDCDHGVKLWESDPLIAITESPSGNSMEDCRRYGVKVAGEKTAEWKAKGYSNVSTNVKCWWEPAKDYGLEDE